MYHIKEWLHKELLVAVFVYDESPFFRALRLVMQPIQATGLT